jgi:OmcA/MtrC family decaheme c-type cytochrome
MGHRRFAAQWLRHLAAAGLVGAALAGCSGDDGTEGQAGPSGVVIAPITGATTLAITITGVTISSPPTVTFRVTNQNGESVTGLTADDVRFTIAKLVPGTFGNPPAWQSYINTTASGAAGTAIQATREGGTTGSLAGTFQANGDGTYTYTFRTDIAHVTSPLGVTYDSNLTHRVGIQTRGTVPLANGVYTFRPSDGATAGIFTRDIVKTAKCNECHNLLQAHDQRIEAKYCVTCHNPGSSDPDTGNTVDFKVMIHKIHRGEELPSVVAGGSYRIIGFGGAVHDYSTVVFPQDIRNCTKCHDGADPATPQGDNWKIQPSREACGSCHDNVNFVTGAGHAGGPKDNSTCLACHSTGGEVGPVADSHSFPARYLAASDRFKFSIVSATPTTAGSTPTITFKIEKDGVGLANFRSDPAFTAGGNSTLNLRQAWSTNDFSNAGSTGNYGQPLTINLLTDVTVAAGANAGEYTVTGRQIPVGTTGTMRVFMDGHPAGDVTTAGTYADRLVTKSVFRDFAVSGSLAARRLVVDIAKCDSCHQRLSLHGNNRNDEPGVCVACHNPNATDKSRRVGVGVDGKTEESIDMKTMIHAIHAGQKDDPATTAVVEGHGFREKGIVVYGFCTGAGCTNPVDFSHVRFPGVLNDCSACHISGTYELAGRWVEPSQGGGILGTSVETSALADDASDDLKISPTAAVCSSCHDSTSAKEHMVTQGNAIGVGSSPPATQATLGLNYELCSICHGPGRVADVKVVHGVK